MSLLKKLQTIPAISKFMMNRYAPYRGADIEIEKMDLANYHIRVKMPLTRKNQNVVGVHFGGSLYSMVDPFFMLLLMHHLGSKYIVWDKSANINFLSPGRNTVYADIRLDAAEIAHIKELTDNYAPVHRRYTVNIFDDAGIRIADLMMRASALQKWKKRSISVEKTLNQPLDNKKALVDQALLLKLRR